jgi:hypothetical protein
MLQVALLPCPCRLLLLLLEVLLLVICGLLLHCRACQLLLHMGRQPALLCLCSRMLGWWLGRICSKPLLLLLPFHWRREPCVQPVSSRAIVVLWRYRGGCQ